MNKRQLTYLRQVVPCLLRPDNTLRPAIERRDLLRDVTTRAQRRALSRITLPAALELKALLP